MADRARKAPVPMEDFKPFYKRDGLIWVPYLSESKWRLHNLTPEMVVKAIGYALPLLADGKVIPFAIKAARNRLGGLLG